MGFVISFDCDFNENVKSGCVKTGPESTPTH